MLLLFLLAVAYFLRGAFAVDSDFGFHLVVGRMILEQGVPKTDPFTYTMPSFPYVDHAWLLDAATAQLYDVGGFWMLSAVFTLAALAALLLSSRGEVTTSFLLASTAILPFFRVRAQVFSWLLLAILLFVLLDEKRWKTLRFFSMFYFLFWANFHGSFLAGLVSVALVLIVRTWRKRTDIWDIVLFAASIAITFINPYGTGIWREALSSVFDSKLRWNIDEWMPGFMMDFTNAALWVFFAVSIVLMARYWRKFQAEELVLYGFFLFQGFSSKRHWPLWVIIALPITARLAQLLFDEVKRLPDSAARFRKLCVWTRNAAIAIFVIQNSYMLGFIPISAEGFGYPHGAVDYLHEHPSAGNIFAPYAWGGYLIWQYPEKRVFIDGRMPSWRWDPPNDTELASAFDTYVRILQGEDSYQEVFEKFSVDTVLWGVPGKTSWQERAAALLLGNELLDEPSFDFIEQLEKDGWRQVYRDDVAIVYQSVQ